MTLRIGFFEEFKSGKSVLLHGSTDDIVQLLDRLRRFAKGSESALPIHDLAMVSRNHPAKLFAIAPVARSASLSRSDAGFIWDCTSQFRATEAMLEQLTVLRPKHPPAMPGYHQYFDLVGTNTQLIVAVDEYDDAWWEKFA